MGFFSKRPETADAALSAVPASDGVPVENIEPAVIEEPEISEDFVSFSRPYLFEGKEYRGLDMSCLNDLTARNLTDAERLFNKTGNFASMPEINMQYCMYVAVQATNLPVEFFNGLPAKDLLKIKNRMITDFFGDGE